MSHTTNPGLLYSRFYFDDRYDKVLDQEAWRQMLKDRHDEAEDVKEKEHEEKQERARRNAERNNRTFNPREYNRARFPGASLSGFKSDYLLDPPQKGDRNFTAYNNHFSLRNHQLFTTQLTEQAIKRNREEYRGRSTTSLELTTTYPGLLVGLGYNHAVSAEQALNAGFSFDHTTGLPLIPGSTVKGILRAAFPQRDVDRSEANNVDHPGWYRETAASKEAWITDTLTQIIGAERTKNIDLKVLETELFASQLPPMRQPVFHDATVVGASGNLFGPDNITRHVNYAEGKDIPPYRYKNPNPVSLLKVMPGVTFSFTFRLPEKLSLNTYGEEGQKHQAYLTQEEIRDLFNTTLLTFGAGAKSRLGYGRFAEETVDFPSKESLVAAEATFATFEPAGFKRSTIVSPEPKGRDEGNRQRERRDETREDPKLRAIRLAKEQREQEALEKDKARAEVKGITVSLTYKGKVGKWHSFSLKGQVQKITLKNAEVQALGDLSNKKGETFSAKVTARDGSLPGSPVTKVEFIL